MSLILCASGCASASRDRDRAFLEAGRQIRLKTEGQSYDAARRDLELFLQRDVDDVIARARRRKEKDASLYRAIAITGLAAGVVAGTSGTLGDPGNEGTKRSLTGGGSSASPAE